MKGFEVGDVGVGLVGDEHLEAVPADVGEGVLGAGMGFGGGVRRDICPWAGIAQASRWARLREVDIPGPFGAMSRRVGSAVEGIAQDVAGTVVPLAVDAVDVNELVERVDFDAVMEKLDVNKLLERIDFDAVMDKLDINGLMTRIDIDTLVDRIDLNAVLDRVDANRLVARIDLDQVLQRVDLNELLNRVDINELVKRIDIDAIVARSDLETIVARSTSSLATEALDAVRSQGVGLDGFVNRWVDRLLGRHSDRPPGPAALLPPKTAQ